MHMIFTLLSKFDWPLFKMPLAALGSCHVIFFRQGVNKFRDFRGFRSLSQGVSNVSNVNIDNPSTFHEGSMPNRVFRYFGPYLRDQTTYVKRKF